MERVFDPQDTFLRRSNKIFLLLSAISLFLDPLFFYLPEIDNYRKCLHLDTQLKTAATTLRFTTDALYIFRVIFQFRTGFSSHSYVVVARSDLVVDSWKIARRYLKSDFLIDVLAMLPLPQVAILLIVPKMGGSKILNTKNLLKFIISFQFVPRFLRFYRLFQETAKRNRVIVALLFYIWAGHVVGGFWYLFAIERELSCWQEACGSHFGCDPNTLYCNGHSGDEAYQKLSQILNAKCPMDAQGRSPFDFGMFIDAHNSGVLQSRNFWQKLVYCFWWSLQNLSTLGQNLKTSINFLEIGFAVGIFIGGLVVFSLVIGIIQATMLSSTIRAEKMKMKWQDVEHWMDTYSLPANLRKRVKQHQQYKWRKTKGVDVNNLLNSLPRDLKRSITRHLCFGLLMRVPMFGEMDEQLLDAICDRLKPALYTENTCIVREGDPLDEMLFIMRGCLVSETTNGGRTGIFNLVYLKAGDFCGEGMLTWALDPTANLPISRRTVRTRTEVEAFALGADDLKFIGSQFRQLHSKQVKHTLRFYSAQWRTWATCYIQTAWRRHRRRQFIKSRCQEEIRLQEASKTGRKKLSLSSAIYATRFAANVLRARRSHLDSIEERSALLPPEPEITVEEADFQKYV